VALSPRHETALRYAAAGIPVFPCRPGDKRPATAKSFHDATTDPDQINRWWAEADYNLALEPEQAGWCVVDLDPKNGGIDAWEALDGDKPETYTVRTPSGGKHLYFQGSMGPSASRLALGTDIRGSRSYVLIPPSVVNNTPYTVVNEADPAPLPAWIPNTLGSSERLQAQTLTTEIELDLPDNIDRARQRLRSLVAADDVAHEGEGGDDRTYRLAAELLNLGLTPETVQALILAEWNNHCDPPWSEDDLAEKVQNATRYAQNEPGSWGQLQGIPEAWKAGAEANPPAPELPMPAFRSWPSIRNAHFDPPQWVWQDRLLAFEPNLYTGDAGVGKTTLAENLAAAVVCGIPLLGQQTRKMPVALLVAEDHYGPVRDNLRAIAHSFGVAEHDGLSDIHILSVKSDRVPGGHVLARISDDGRIDDTRFLREVVAPFLRSFNSEVLWIIDPLAEFVAFNNLSDIACRTLATSFLAECCAINGNRVTALVNDHPSKAGMAAGHHYAGSVQLKAAFSLMATLIGGEWSGTLTKQRKLSFVVKKGRYAADDKVDFYRVGSSPAFTLEGTPGHDPREIAGRVYRLVAERLDQGLRTGKDNRSDYGPGSVAHELGMEQRDVEKALSYCRGQGWLVYETGAGKGGRDRTPSGWALGHVTPLLAALVELEPAY
jgi:hypothetical protein